MARPRPDRSLAAALAGKAGRCGLEVAVAKCAMPSPPSNARVDAKIVALRESGLAIALIAERFNASRRKIYQVLVAAQRRPAKERG
jgi:hypothetical protein